MYHIMKDSVYFFNSRRFILEVNRFRLSSESCFAIVNKQGLRAEGRARGKVSIAKTWLISFGELPDHKGFLSFNNIFILELEKIGQLAGICCKEILYGHIKSGTV
jgi:hypothetical protein